MDGDLIFILKYIDKEGRDGRIYFTDLFLCKDDAVKFMLGSALMAEPEPEGTVAILTENYVTQDGSAVRNTWRYVTEDGEWYEKVRLE